MWHGRIDTRIVLQQLQWYTALASFNTTRTVIHLISYLTSASVHLPKLRTSNEKKNILPLLRRQNLPPAGYQTGCISPSLSRSSESLCNRPLVCFGRFLMSSDGIRITGSEACSILFALASTVCPMDTICSRCFAFDDWTCLSSTLLWAILVLVAIARLQILSSLANQ